MFTFRGRTWAVEAPCVFIQWPGEMMEYGPSPQSKTWSELSLVYDASQLDTLRARHLAVEDKPLWPVRRPSLMQEQLSILEGLLQQPIRDGAIDRIDRTCELLIVESRLGEDRPPLGRDETIIRKVRQHVRQHYTEHHDFDAIARAHNLSPATFRRYWNTYVHTPPAHYVMHLRMREACRRLAETDNTIAEIATQLGFEDPLYFSRRFSEMMGMTATTYRRHHAIQR